jgi:hypothetical protein
MIQRIKPLFTYTIGDAILQSHDAEKELVGKGAYSLMKQITVKVNVTGMSTLRTYFELRSADAARTAYGKILPNGTERTTNSTTYVGFSEDIAAGWGIAAGTINIYGYGQSYATIYCQNFRLKGSITPSPTVFANTY